MADQIKFAGPHGPQIERPAGVGSARLPARRATATHNCHSGAAPGQTAVLGTTAQIGGYFSRAIEQD